MEPDENGARFLETQITVKVFMEESGHRSIQISVPPDGGTDTIGLVGALAVAQGMLVARIETG